MQPNLTGSRVLFVSAASSDVGFGHLSRCLSLASYAQLCGADIEFLVFGDLDAKDCPPNPPFKHLYTSFFQQSFSHS